ncbi:histidine kinase [Natrialba taiwanensis DSM 12281]|uniref:Histidine kinase n=1 Tax=Natrialba taiwanensis DSM 12281 TaxID=1230458 RepID=M0A9G4_9EURY|nr:histidine kinase [Natrialba taiwanensis DSM 12281]
MALSPHNQQPTTSTVQLLIEETGNRAALRKLLEDHYEIRATQSIGKADLYLVDDHTFPEYHTALQERVDRSDPVFCPVVLIRRADSNPHVSLPDLHEREPPYLIDDIVDAPIDRSLLVRRLNSLLVRREQSKDLLHYISQLEASNQSLEQFAYAASHDLQEPLRMVSSYLHRTTLRGHVRRGRRGVPRVRYRRRGSHAEHDRRLARVLPHRYGGESADADRTGRRPRRRPPGPPDDDRRARGRHRSRVAASGARRC